VDIHAAERVQMIHLHPGGKNQGEGACGRIEQRLTAEP